MKNSESYYKCGVCGRGYDTIDERSQCEQVCLRKQKEEAEKAAQQAKYEKFNKADIS